MSYEHDTPDTGPEAIDFARQAELELEAAERVLLVLTTSEGSTVEQQQAQAEQSRRVWELHSLVHRINKRLDDATKASKAAVEQGKLAVSLSKSKLADRVAALEKYAADSLATGGRIRAASRKARAK